jgi:1-acyl-sn-glycerol-3-phosphate acyltransferase
MLLSMSRTLFRQGGWKVMGSELAEHRRCVVTAAPHTSNWDLFYTIAAFDAMNLPMRFTIKKEWLRFPFDRIVGPVGAIGIDRTPRRPGEARPSMTDAMVRLFEDEPGELALVVTPEGTRSRRTEWKTGFWHVARQAQVPILLGYLDYARKEAGIGMVIHPTDLEGDMRRMMAFYGTCAPFDPSKFSLDVRYS